ncbi:ATP phosphoribosyltransferase regulatory subunit [Ferroacidibacillus organovorans]|uniref:ATP phosphoribosyltransferase regulatory subunit n=1 Tax=Ferroacidibacillus organovorans TaxID=1765683 RepID=A0A162SUZ5_9BACL|nr:ATP phosphoribosyltransferase regulatory subunit [Ferroacidibacillus organovorans]KYP80174.1 hypothetical protein AYJ22_02740 [Ferroacidibacillus organovorans]OAG95051.1 hypothetical protein AYW79_02215 [Ferroacidibacillus organovorans]OPG17630.1 ATP phosphoribosyltransferase regulatory subunit [Ferroacidibacillus organovorans]
MARAWERPVGTRDFFGDAMRQRNQIIHAIRNTAKTFDYDEIETPMLEYSQTFQFGLLRDDEERLFRTFDPAGHTLALRPEMTTPVARVAATLLAREPLPLRLMYAAKTYQTPTLRAKQTIEVTQAGFECIGDEGLEADAEVIALAVRSLQALGIQTFRIAIGHTGYVQTWFEKIPETLARGLRQAMLEKDWVQYETELKPYQSATWYDAVRSLPRVRGTRTALLQARSAATDPAGRACCDELLTLFDLLDLYGVLEYVHVDLGLVLDHDYYTGPVFEGYAEHLGQPICVGGRYDNLLGCFDRPLPATGCALFVERLMRVVAEPQEEEERIVVRYVEKGRMSALSFAEWLRRKGSIVRTERMPSDAMGAEGETAGGCSGGIMRVLEVSGARVHGDVRLQDDYRAFLREGGITC